MKALTLALFAFALVFGAMNAPATAQDLATCQAQAVSKATGKPLVGKSKTAYVNQCMRSTCEAKALGHDGKKLAGIAKNSFMKKCLKGA